ncbi:MAG: hypothetical protein ACRDMJ_17690, partial [Solirubrobacteraceae bacterium]
MAPIPYATLSVHHFISTYGAYAGFAAVLGLAILVLLFFSQARDGAVLRRRAEDAEDELHSLQSYVSQLSRSLEQVRATAGESAGPGPVRVAPPPAAALAATPAPSRGVPVPRPTVVPASQPAVAAIPFAPAGVGAPALSSATRLIPAGVEDQISIRAAAPAVAAGAGLDGQLEPAAVGAGAPIGDGERSAVPSAVATIAAPVPLAGDSPEPGHELGPDAGVESTESTALAGAPEVAEPSEVAEPREPAGPPPSTAAGGANGANGHGAQAPPSSGRGPAAAPP